MSNPNQPILNAGVKYVNGLCLAWSSNTALLVSSGAARDNRDENDIIIGNFPLNPLLAPINQNITLRTTFVGPNGLDDGVIAANAHYGVYVIGDSSGNHPAAALLSNSTFVPQLPNGYDIFRRIGWTRTDGSANLLKFYQYGRNEDRTYYYDVSISVLAAGNATTFTDVSLSAAVPTIFSPYASAVSEVMFKLVYVAAAAANFAQFITSASASASPIVTWGTGVATPIAQRGNITIPSSTGGIKYKVSAAGDALALDVIGFKDYLSTPQ